MALGTLLYWKCSRQNVVLFPPQRVCLNALNWLSFVDTFQQKHFGAQSSSRRQSGLLAESVDRHQGDLPDCRRLFAGELIVVTNGAVLRSVNHQVLHP